MKNKISKIAILLLLTAIVVSFNNKYFVFDGGTINNPVIAIPVNTLPPAIKATNATGCADTVAYQWQQSTNGINFFDIPNATGVYCQPDSIKSMIFFRRKATCPGGGDAYTNNVATIILVTPS